MPSRQARPDTLPSLTIGTKHITVPPGIGAEVLAKSGGFLGPALQIGRPAPGADSTHSTATTGAVIGCRDRSRHLGIAKKMVSRAATGAPRSVQPPPQLPVLGLGTRGVTLARASRPRSRAKPGVNSSGHPSWMLFDGEERDPRHHQGDAQGWPPPAAGLQLKLGPQLRKRSQGRTVCSTSAWGGRAASGEDGAAPVEISAATTQPSALAHLGAPRPVAQYRGDKASVRSAPARARSKRREGGVEIFAWPPTANHARRVTIGANQAPAGLPGMEQLTIALATADPRSHPRA